MAARPPAGSKSTVARQSTLRMSVRHPRSADVSRRLSPRKIPSALRHNDLRRAMFRARLRPMSQRIDIWGSARNVIGGIFGVSGDTQE